MEYLTPDAYGNYWSKKTLQEIEEEKKKVEEALTVTVEENTNLGNSIMMQNNVSNLEHLNEVAEEDREFDVEVDQIAVDKKNQAKVTGEESQVSLYMSYLRILNRLITEKSLYTDEALFKSLLRTKSQEELIETRNKLVNDINAYNKTLEKIKAKSILLSSPLTRWMVKEEKLVDNADTIEIIMKKEEYVKFIDTELLHVETK